MSHYYKKRQKWLQYSQYYATVCLTKKYVPKYSQNSHNDPEDSGMQSSMVEAVRVHD